MTNIKYGIVVDNNDIYDSGKIRVLELEKDLPSGYRAKNITELKTILSNLDVKGNHVPWQKGSNVKTSDPFLADPFLPKNINPIPEVGQLVKIILYDNAIYKEYVGPYISDLENINEGYINSLNSYKITNKKNLIDKGYVNKVKDYGLHGKNSQLLLSDKEFLLRTNHQDYQTKRKNSKLAMIQQSTYNNTMLLDRKVVNELVEPEKLITHLLEVTIEKKIRTVLNEKTIIGNINLISVINHVNQNGKIGLTSKTYSPTKEYTDGLLEISFEIKTDDTYDIIKFIDELKNGLLNKRLPQLATLIEADNSLQTTLVEKTYEVLITDHRKMTLNHSVITDRKEVDVLSLVIRMGKDQKNYEVTDDALEFLGVSSLFIKTNPKFYAKEKSNLELINQITNIYDKSFTVLSKIMNEGPRLVNKLEDTVTIKEKTDSHTTTLSNKILLLSSSVNPNIISDNANNYGLTQKEVAELVNPKTLNTFSTLRGEKLISILITIIDLFISHGHSTGVTVKNSMEDDTRSKLIKIKEELTKNVNNDLSGGTDILNQYIRIN